ncbi:MAG: NADH-quinone oxidoreductase subunit N [Actinomycetota bacterium]
MLAQTSFDLPSVDWGGLTPLLIMAGTPLVFLTLWSLASGFLPKRTPSIVATLAGIGTIIAAAIQWGRIDGGDEFATIAGSYTVDGFSMLLTMLIAAAVSLTAFFAHDYLEREDINSAEFFVLLMLSASGGIVMAGANDLIVLFLGLEVLSIAVYILAAAHLRRFESQEAGIKYFVLGAFASAFLLYGIALAYGATGSTNLSAIAAAADGGIEDLGLLYGAMALLLVGFGFKIAAVPFHAWTPDVYHGSPSPVVSFMASAVKVGGFAALLRVFWSTFGSLADDWSPMIFALACLSMVFGTVVGIVQDNVKRMLAYSSISHAGFILVGAEAATTEGLNAALYYLTAYTFIAIGSFAIISVASPHGDDATSIDDYRGLAARKPWLAFGFTVLLLAQAGVPFTTGFLGKFRVIGAAIDNESYVLGVIAMLAAVVGAFLYLRIMLAMYAGDDDADAPTGRDAIPWTATLTIGVTVAFTLVFGIFADPIIDLVNDATVFEAARG